MTFEIKFSKQATKFIKRLPEDIKDRIKRKFKEVSEGPPGIWNIMREMVAIS